MQQSLDVSGTWKLALGEARPTTYPAHLTLPGSLQAQGFGSPVDAETAWTGQIINRSWFTDERFARYRKPGNVKVPFWLQPERHFVGVAWMQREIDVPAAWAGRRIALFLERPHIATTVWIDDRLAGTCNSLGAPHVHELGCDLAPGRHVLTIAVDNRLQVNVGTNAHSVSDHTQGNWNGIVGCMELRATSPVWIENAQLFPDLTNRVLRVRIELGNHTGRAGQGTLALDATSYPVRWDVDGARLAIDHPLDGNAALWDEFAPNVHTLNLRLAGDGVDDLRAIRHGLREVRVEGRHILLNNRRIFLRGTLECAVFPKAGHPPTDTGAWRHIFSRLRDYGFNHVRFHSWCPPGAAFEVADEMGFYLQVECSSWANSTTGLGVDPALDAWLYEEARAIIKAYGNHPSFLLMCYGNEPGGRMHEYLTDWLRHWKAAEPRRLHTSAAGWPKLDESQFDNLPQPRLHRWGEGLESRLNGQPPGTCADYRLQVLASPRPLVAHETGQWCAYPDLSEIPRCQGPLRARNYEIFRDAAAENHLLARVPDFVRASGRLQALCYREEIETALRTRDFAGYQLLQANDFPGQGTAPVGWFNAFWEEKGYTDAAEFRRFQAPTVVLARLERRTFSAEDTLHATFELAHFGPNPLAKAEVEWSLRDASGMVRQSGQFAPRPVPIGNGIVCGALACPLAGLPAPAKYRLVAGIRGTDIENDWEIWVYPLDGAWRAEGGVVVTRNVEEVLARATDGGAILFLPSREPGDVQLGFTPIFWNTAWTRAQAPHTLGILCDPAHPALARFPTEFHTNWQWWEVLDRAKAVILDALPPELVPLVTVIDDWATSQRLGLVFECRVGRARVLVCGADVNRLPGCRHAARQFRDSLVAYMQSDRFDPAVAVEPDALRRALAARSPYADVKPR
ncbi:MAG TPA: glycoside hydrolase family 2 TIM barrel-domain containing protein [Kiritimatiellia bacterium]|nr:glycoside hydrolase family 2 TIM barrel-domain containing protein [Kiritimatiellia bacterium]